MIWQYCDLCETAVKYEPEVFETKESASKELDIRTEEHKEHLCRDCTQHFAECDGEPEFGNCVGNDNVISCDKHERTGDD